MKSLNRFAPALLILVVLFAALSVGNVGSVSAATNICFGLKDADCKVLSAADAKLADLTSFAYETELTMKITFQGTINTKLKGSGKVAIDPSKAEPGSTDQLAILKPVTLSLNYSGSTTTVNGTASNSTPFAGKLILSDNVLYFKPAGAAAWKGAELSSLQSASNSADVTASLNSNPQLVAFVKDPAVIKAIASIPNIRNFIKQTKTATSPSYDNQKQSEFVMAFDFPTLVRAKEMYPVLRGLMTMSAPTASVTDAQLGPVATALGTALKGSSMKITRWVGTTDSAYHALTIDFVINFNPGLAGVRDMKAMGINIHFGIKMKDIGKPLTIEVPTDVEMVSATPAP